MIEQRTPPTAEETGAIARRAAELNGQDWQTLPHYSRGRWESLVREAWNGITDQTPVGQIAAQAVAEFKQPKTEPEAAKAAEAAKPKARKQPR